MSKKQEETQALTLAEIKAMSIDELSDEQLQVLWDSQKPQYSKLNEIKVNNQKIDDKGINPRFGQIKAIKYELIDGLNTASERMIEPNVTQFYVIKERAHVKSPWGEDAPQYNIPEVESGQPISIVDNQTGELLYNGPYKEAKEKFRLRYSQALYVAIDGVVYRWCINGDSLTSWFNLKKAMGKKNCPVMTKVSRVEEQKSPAGIYWNNIHFALGDEITIREALKMQSALNKEFVTPPEAPATEDEIDAIFNS